jgi:hypothetical protein
VGISSMDDSNFVINSQSDIIYFIIKVDRLPLGKKVLHLENTGNNPLACFQFKGNLMAFSQGTLNKYVYNAATDKDTGPTQVAGPNFGCGVTKTLLRFLLSI